MKRLIKFNAIILSISLLMPTLNTVTINKNEIFTVPKTIEKSELSLKDSELTVNTNLRKKCNFTSTDYNEMLKYTNLNNLGDYFKQAEDLYNVNGLYIVGLACLESGYGKSGYAVYRNNLFGWNAIDSNPNNASYFNSKGDCILYVAEKLSKNYLTENGLYFEGYTPRNIDVHYCTDKLHADKIVKIVENLVKEV